MKIELRRYSETSEEAYATQYETPKDRHHLYRIHIWQNRRAVVATVATVATCSPSSWHKVQLCGSLFVHHCM